MSDLFVEVVVVGTGPGGMAVSVMLEGWAPFLDGGNPHAREHPLYSKIADRIEGAQSGGASVQGVGSTSLIDLDMAGLSGGLRGRSNNPIALFADHLLHPSADGRPWGHPEPLVQFRKEAPRVPHLVVGDNSCGGSWTRMKADLLTLSPSSWMSLPGYSLHQYLAERKRTDVNERARVTRSVIAEYYEAYGEKFGFSERLVAGRVVEAVPCRWESQWLWKVTVEDEANRQQRVLHCRSLVLSGGMYATPHLLGIPGERDFDWVHHRIPHEWEAAPASSHNEAGGATDSNGDAPTILVVGGGLSAGDCIAHALRTRWNVVHVFRTEAKETKIVSKFGTPSYDYQEYYAISQLMTGSWTSETYTPMARHELIEIKKGHECVLASTEADNPKRVVLRNVDRVSVLIGSSPDLSFLPRVREAAAPRVTEPQRAFDQDSTHPVYIDVDPFTMRATPQWMQAHVGDAPAGSCSLPASEHVQEGSENTPSSSYPPPLYATGPLRGDNFVRFVVGDAWAIRRDLTATPRADLSDGGDARGAHTVDSAVGIGGEDLE